MLPRTHALLVLLVYVALANGAACAEADKSADISAALNAKMTVDLQEADLKWVLEVLTFLSGVKIEFAPDAAGKAKSEFTLKAIDISLGEILGRICKEANLKYEIRKSRIVFMREAL